MHKLRQKHSVKFGQTQKSIPPPLSSYFGVVIFASTIQMVRVTCMEQLMSLSLSLSALSQLLQSAELLADATILFSFFTPEPTHTTWRMSTRSSPDKPSWPKPAVPHATCGPCSIYRCHWCTTHTRFDGSGWHPIRSCHLSDDSRAMTVLHVGRFC